MTRSARQPCPPGLLRRRGPIALVLAGLVCSVATTATVTTAATATLAGTVEPAGDPGELLERIRSTRLDPARAVGLRDIELEIGIAELEVERGVLIPTHPVAGRTVELVFIGQARFRCDPPDQIEAGQIELFTGRRELDAAIEEAVLIIANQATVDQLLDRPAARELRPALVERAEGIHQDWLQKTERRNTGVESAIFRSLVGDVAFRGYFAVWASSHELGDFVYQLDPEDTEQLTVASFVPIGVSGWDRVRVRRQIRTLQRKGRWLGVRVEDLGAWDVWLSAPWTGSAGPPLPGNVGFETERYTLDVTVRKRKMRLEGTARLELEALDSGRRAVPLDLFRDLKVERVVDGAGRELFSFRSGLEVVVLLAEPTVAGERLQLEVTYGGQIIKQAGRKTFDLENTSTWYPHCGAVDRARYDVTLRWPRKYELLAGGRRVDGGLQGNYRWERRVLDTPALAFSFALGDFVIDRRRSGHVELTVAFNRHTTWRLTPELRETTLDSVASSLRFFEELFGPYPLDHLTVAILPRDYSQSYPSFITLTDTVVRPDLRGTQEQIDWLRANTIAHEVSHQWWGNLVGWWSYRDQWLSEGMANYSGLLYHAHASGEGGTALARSSAMWRDSLTRLTLGGRTIESLGPVVLGARLNSSQASNGYRAIVYRKGAVVLAMLARTMGEERFLEMLRALVDAAAYRVLSTEEFLDAIEHMSESELDGFARQFIYGTGIPQVYYDYEVARGDDGDWSLRGSAHWMVSPTFAHRVERTEQGWNLTRVAREGATTDTGGMMVPFRLVLDSDEPPPPDAPRREVVRKVRQGMIFLDGRQGEFEIATAERPVELRLDPGNEILAYFHSAADEPRRVIRYRAQDLAHAGMTDEAEAAFLRALELPLGPRAVTDSIPWTNDQQAELRQDEALIRLALARLYLEQARREDAASELDTVDALLGPDRLTLRVERDTLRSWLEILQGEYEPAFQRLKKTLKLASPGETGRGWRSTLWRIRLGAERLAMIEAWALLAVAAYETGHADEMRWAIAEAVERGAEMDALQERVRSGL